MGMVTYQIHSSRRLSPLWFWCFLARFRFGSISLVEVHRQIIDFSVLPLDKLIRKSSDDIALRVNMGTT